MGRFPRLLLMSSAVTTSDSIRTSVPNRIWTSPTRTTPSGAATTSGRIVVSLSSISDSASTSLVGLGQRSPRRLPREVSLSSWTGSPG